jgi:hypothetical protein
MKLFVLLLCLYTLGCSETTKDTNQCKRVELFQVCLNMIRSPNDTLVFRCDRVSEDQSLMEIDSIPRGCR